MIANRLVRGTGLWLIAWVSLLWLAKGVHAAEPGAAGSSKSVVYKTVGERELRIDMDLPAGWKTTDRRPTIVFWSGGGFRSGNTRQFEVQAKYFADRGMVALRAEYRDSTKDNADIRMCTEDAVSAMRWIRGRAAEYGIDPDRIVSSGGSAGGYLAAAICTAPADLHGADDDLSISTKPNAMVLFNPALVRSSSNTRLSAADAQSSDRAVSFGLSTLSPVGRLKKDFPPMVILIGSRDPFLEVCREFCSEAQQDGGRAEIEVYEGQPHAFFNGGEWKPKTIERADLFLQEIGYLAAEPKVPLPPPAPEREQTQRARRASN